ncbi:SDR family oxidoreductase [Mangrovivirga cuniculi]|uniref:Oxidoreductase n=1 Tax=Mangrovivirga cuniculi TaxID=2715131 RepID=A0A4D7JMT7_9BACT|nr:SDR family oxidoreductase [Mangrovivirga cuniculi]QCK15967.1 oxidoreductase [Mangrovivirga cuniculi]
MEIKDKTVLITGASSGIGEATARLLAEKGANVVLGARRQDEIEKTASEIGERALAIQLDVTDKSQVKNFIDKAIEKFGSIDVLINNAGVGYLGPVAEGKLEDFHNMFDVNVNGLLSCIHYSLPHLLKSSGHIINLASVAAHDVFPGSVVYAASKHAVDVITRGIRLELRDKVRISNISPGAVDTEFKDHTHHKETAEKFEDYFSGTVLKSKDIAESIYYMLSQPDHAVINEIIIRPDR